MIISDTPIIISYICTYISLSSYNEIFKIKSAGNQRRYSSSLVGTSETTRVATFGEWLAGVIDGDGSLQVSKQGYTSLEITIGLEDLPLLRVIQDKIGGSIKIRSGAKAYRYRLHNKEGILHIIHTINGFIRHSSRLVQLHQVCIKLEISIIIPHPLTSSSTWFAGFFDADGTITISIKNNRPQITISVTNKHLCDVQWFKDIFGGYIYFDTSQNGYYSWTVQSRDDIFIMLSYFKNAKCRSSKSQRFYLVEEYFRLRDINAFQKDNIYHKAWENFITKWKKLKI